jgi:hypothetical protein
MIKAMALAVRWILIYSIICSISMIQAASWSASVDTWSTDRQSSTLNFSYVDNMNGSITDMAVTAQGRSIKGYHSHFLDINLNNIRLKERTSAKTGEIGGEEKVDLVSVATNDVVNVVSKPVNDLNYYFDYTERWPVKLSARRAMGYLGEGINDQEFSSNNMDYVGSNSLYGKRYYLDRFVILNLNRTNISVVATISGGFKNADFLFTKNTSFRQEIWSTGIADLRYHLASMEGTRPDVTGEERFFGDYKLKTRLFMDADNIRLDPSEEGLQCLTSCGPQNSDCMNSCIETI